MSDWKFPDAPNVAVFVSREIVESDKWIAYVSHDADDGAWQFHANTQEGDIELGVMLISLHSAFELDPSIGELADLPLGWCGWRDAQSSAWQREPLGHSEET